MPFSKTNEEHTESYWTDHFTTFLKPRIEECEGVTAHRSEPLRGDILRQIIKDVVLSPVVVADLTDGNPNVYWELGVRQSFKHGTVTIAEKGTKIPFDVSVKGILFYYPKDHIKNARFVKEFKKAIMDCLSHPDTPDSHVLETVSGRGTLFQIIRRDESTRRVKALISEFNDNFSILNDLYKSMEKEYMVDRFRLPSIELLITHRYLDEIPSFYKVAENYFSWLLTMNEQLNLWEQAEESVDAWFLKARKDIYKVFNMFKKALTGTQKKLAVSF